MPRKKLTAKPEEVKKVPVKKKAVFYQAIGRRKTATARVRIYPVLKDKITVGNHLLDKDEMVVNDRPIKQYFPGTLFEKLYTEPFRSTNNLGRFAATIKVEGSGLVGQLRAVMHGISRALLEIDKVAYRPPLKAMGLLTRDPREKERRKAGLAGKARAGKQSPKR